MVSGMNRWGLSRDEMRASADATRPRWKKSSGTTVVGHVMRRVQLGHRSASEGAGYQYARKRSFSGGFAFPEDPMNFLLTFSSLILKKCRETGGAFQM